MQIEPIAIYFEIPATDPMGHDHVEGKIRGLDDVVLLHWKIRDRTFTQGTHKTHEIALKYHEVEDVEFRQKFWSQRCHLIFRVCDPAKLEGMPGIQVGRCVLRVARKSREDARRLARFLDYKVSEYRRDRSEEKISDLLENLQSKEI